MFLRFGLQFRSVVKRIFALEIMNNSSSSIGCAAEMCITNCLPSFHENYIFVYEVIYTHIEHERPYSVSTVCNYFVDDMAFFIPMLKIETFKIIYSFITQSICCLIPFYSNI